MVRRGNPRISCQALAYVYFEDEPHFEDEPSQRIGVNIAKA